MTRSVLAALLVLLMTAPAVAKNYLSDQAAFDAAWEALTEEAGLNDGLDGQASFIRVRPDVIELIAPTDRSGRALTTWRVQRTDHIIWGERDTVANHGAPLNSGRFISAQKSLFDSRKVPLGTLVTLAAEAATPVRFKSSPKTLAVEIGRTYVGLRDLAFRDVQWQVIAGTPGDQAEILTDDQGIYIEADISGTVRGRARDFLSQVNWPYAEAQKELARMAGTAPILRLSIRRESVKVAAEHPRTKTKTLDYTWDGGRYKDSGFGGMGQRWHLLGGRAPFDLDAVKLSDVHAMIRTAKRYAGQLGARVAGVDVTNDKAADGGHEIVWTTSLYLPELGGFGNSQEHWIVSVRADGSLARIRLPDSERLGEDYLAPEAVAGSVRLLMDAVGPDVEAYQILFQGRDAVMIHKAPDWETGFAEVKLGRSDIKAIPTIAQGNPEDLFYFKMGKARGLDAAGVAAMYDAAVEALGATNAQVFQARIWGGKRDIFDAGGEPLVLIHLAEPGAGDPKGIVAFRIDGTIAQVFK
ncbi:MAG: hypothetical protein AAGB15_02365 [Pseudomonadota bacterium]